MRGGASLGEEVRKNFLGGSYVFVAPWRMSGDYRKYLYNVKQHVPGPAARRRAKACVVGTLRSGGGGGWPKMRLDNTCLV